MTTTWAALFPEGRTVYYEGSNPDAFAAQIKERFGFDPSNDPQWDSDDPGFHCPPEHLDIIYGSGEWMVGS